MKQWITWGICNVGGIFSCYISRIGIARLKDKYSSATTEQLYKEDTQNTKDNQNGIPKVLK